MVGDMKSKFRETVDVLTKVSSSDSVSVDADHSREQQLAEISQNILVMKVS